jgi:hypothetical protein
LSGGGGKGAYQAGALLALFDCGLTKYCALAGTSVGALNAALFYELCHTNLRDSFLSMWIGISPLRILTPTLTGVSGAVARLALWTLKGIGELEKIARRLPSDDVEVIEAKVPNISFYQFVVSQLIIPAVFALPLSLAGVYLIGEIFWGNDNWFFRALYAGLILFVIFRGREILGVFRPWMLFFLIPPVVAKAVQWLMWLEPNPATWDIYAVLCLVAFILLLFNPLNRWLRIHMSLFSNAPLRSSIMRSDLEAMRTSSIRIYCTMSTKTKYCFPAPGYVPDVWLPVYMPLNNCENVDEVHNLYQSSH